MKKIGIATFHFVDNYGAVLQCYALQKVINSFDGVQAEVIDYRLPEFRYIKVWNSEKEKLLFHKKRESFERFLVRYCNMSAERVSLIDGKGYDCCCVGSDQIWNPTFYFHPEYFLPNVSPDVDKIAYAASVGCSVPTMRIHKDIFVKNLPSFRAISAREQEHIEYLSELSGKHCECVLDPTLLLDADDYLPIINNVEEAVEKPYLFFFWLPHDREFFRGVEFANALARSLDLQIIHSMPGIKENVFFGEDKCMYFKSIERFLWYIKHASFIITNSYHGTIFSIQFERPFYSFIVESMKSRFQTLLSYTNMEDRIVNCMIRPEDVNVDIDYAGIKKRIFSHRKRSINYLKRALDVE